MTTEHAWRASSVTETPFGYPVFVDRGSFRFFSGLTASGNADTATDWISLADADMGTQADRIFQRIDELTAAEGGLSSVLRLHFFQKDKRYFPALEWQRFKHEGERPSPSSGLGLSVLSGGRDCAVEIDALAASGRGRQRYGERIHEMSVGAGDGASHYAQVSGMGPYSFLAGMIPINTRTGKVPQGYEDVPIEARWMKTGRSHPDSRTGPIAAQAWTVYRQVIDHLEKHGLDVSRLALVTIYLQHAGDAADVLRVHERMLSSANAAVQMVCVDEVGHKGTLLEVECTAVDDGEALKVSGNAGGFPSAVSAGELTFISDCLGVHDRELEVADVAESILAVLHPTDLLEVTYLKQVWRALSGVKRVLEGRAMDIHSLGHLWVRIVRPHSVEKFELMRKLMFGECDHAVTINRVPAIPQSPRALVAISATASEETP